MTAHAFQTLPVPMPPPVVTDADVGLDGAPLPLGETEVEVWALSAARLAPRQEALAAVLSDDESARRDRFVREVDRVRYGLYHGALRRILARYLDAEPAALEFERPPGGKPELAPPFRATGLTFNLSHTGDLMVLACARHRRVGVDAEQIEEGTDAEALAARFFHPNERAVLARLPAAARRARFFQWWTAREAWLKARGQGLNDELAELDFSSWIDTPWLGLEDECGERWLAWSFGGAEAWAGTLVAGWRPGCIRWRAATGQPVGLGPLRNRKCSNDRLL